MALKVNIVIFPNRKKIYAEMHTFSMLSLIIIFVYKN